LDWHLVCANSIQTQGDPRLASILNSILILSAFNLSLKIGSSALIGFQKAEPRTFILLCNELLCVCFAAIVVCDCIILVKKYMDPSDPPQFTDRKEDLAVPLHAHTSPFHSYVEYRKFAVGQVSMSSYFS